MKKKVIIMLIIFLSICIFLFVNRGEYTEDDIYNIAYNKLTLFLDVYDDKISFDEIENITGISTSSPYFTLEGLPMDKESFEILEAELKSEGDSYTVLVLYSKVIIYTAEKSIKYNFELSLYSPAFNVKGITEDNVDEPFNWKIRWKEITKIVAD